MDHGLPIERSVRDGLLEIGQALNLKPLATNDSHYVTQDQAEAHAALLCVQAGKTLDDPNRFKFDGDGYYLKSAAEMREYWDEEVPGAADHTLLIAERVESYAEVYAFVDRMPRFPVPEGKTEDDLLRAGGREVHPEPLPERAHPEYAERIDMELGVIAKMGFRGVLPGRRRPRAVGQAAEDPGRSRPWVGHRFAGRPYILHITDLDPIEHALIFERFLNPERGQPARHRPRLRRPPPRRGPAATRSTSGARRTSHRSSPSARSRPRPRSRTRPACCTASPASPSPTASPRPCRRRSWPRTSRSTASSTRSTSATPRRPRSAR